MPGGELLAFWAHSHLCWRSQGESRVTVLSLMALSLFLFLSWGLNVLFYCLSSFSTLGRKMDFLRCYDLCFLFFVPERREKMKLWEDFFEMLPTLWKLPQYVAKHFALQVAQPAPAVAQCLGSYSVWGQCLRSPAVWTPGRWWRWFKEAQKDGRGIPENNRIVLPVWAPLFWVKEQLVLSGIPLLGDQVKWCSLGRLCGGRRWHLMEKWNSSLREDPQCDDNSNLLSFMIVQVLCKCFM